MCDKTTQISRTKETLKFVTPSTGLSTVAYKNTFTEQFIPSELLTGLESIPWQFNYPNLLIDLASQILMQSQLTDRWAAQQGYD